MNAINKMVVAYHEGGPLWAGDEAYHPAGWYLFNGKDPIPVTVLIPFTNQEYKP